MPSVGILIRNKTNTNIVTVKADIDLGSGSYHENYT